MLFSPGPTEVDEIILNAQNKIIHHRSKEMSKLYGKLCDWFTNNLSFQESYIFSASGTGGLEAIAANFDLKTLIISNGVFGQKLYDIYTRNNNAKIVNIEEGKGISLERIKEKLDNIEMLLVVQNETSTATLNKLEEIGEYAKKQGILMAVDSISGWPGTRLPTADIVVVASQKALACPPGLSAILLSERALEKRTKSKSYYFDLERYRAFYKKSKQPPSTPAVTLLYALEKALEQIDEKTLQEYYKIHKNASEKTQKWFAKMGLRSITEKGYESPTVSAFYHENPKELVVKANDAGYFLVPAKGKFKESAVRIGHMGFKQIERLDELLEFLEGVV